MTDEELKRSYHTRVVLDEMCKMVGVRRENIDMEQPQWFMDHTWTETQEQLFISWLAGYLLDTPEAREEMMNYPRKEKDYCRKTAQQFVVMYGWTVDL